MKTLTKHDGLSARRRNIDEAQHQTPAWRSHTRAVIAMAIISATAWLPVSCRQQPGDTTARLATVLDTVGLPAKRLTAPVPAWNAQFYNNAVGDSTKYPVFFRQPIPMRLGSPAAPYRLNADTLRRRRVEATRSMSGQS